MSATPSSAPSSRTSFRPPPRITVFTRNTTRLAVSVIQEQGESDDSEGEGEEVMPPALVRPPIRHHRRGFSQVIVPQGGRPLVQRDALFEEKVAVALERRLAAKGDRIGNGAGGMKELAVKASLGSFRQRTAHRHTVSLNGQSIPPIDPNHIPITPPISPPNIEFTSLPSPLPFSSALSPNPFSGQEATGLGPGSGFKFGSTHPTQNSLPSRRVQLDILVGAGHRRAASESFSSSEFSHVRRSSGTIPSLDQIRNRVASKEAQESAKLEIKVEEAATSSRLSLSLLKRRSMPPPPSKSNEVVFVQPEPPILKIEGPSPTSTPIIDSTPVVTHRKRPPPLSSLTSKNFPLGMMNSNTIVLAVGNDETRPSSPQTTGSNRVAAAKAMLSRIANRKSHIQPVSVGAF